ncbi:MAG: DNA repair protein RadC [Lachnospiraceae bacterium]|nr:DNA repair protein RadC [Lachnospiraceae bacterium]
MNTNETTLKQVSGMLPDDKARLYGTEALSDAELLAVLLRSGTQGRNVIAMCEEILHTLGGSLAGLFTTPSEQLLRLSGVGKVKQLQLAAVGELSRRIWKSRIAVNPSFSNSAAVYEVFREDLRFAETEEVHLALLDVRCRMIRRVMLSKGTIRSSLVSPREVFAQAVRHKAASFVLVHNHPSGDPTPSRDDINLTKVLQGLGETMQIPMLDHIIIGDPGYYSFKDNGGL